MMKRMVEEHSVLYLDCSHDEEFSQDHHHFRDGDHLSETGARVFSAKLKQLILAGRPYLRSVFGDRG